MVAASGEEMTSRHPDREWVRGARGDGNGSGLLGIMDKILAMFALPVYSSKASNRSDTRLLGLTSD